MKLYKYLNKSITIMLLTAVMTEKKKIFQIQR